jgi:hypothetical protein
MILSESRYPLFGIVLERRCNDRRDELDVDGTKLDPAERVF